MYKIEYDTVASNVGNVSQGKFTAYTELPLTEIESKLIEVLQSKKLKPVILKIEKTTGHILI